MNCSAVSTFFYCTLSHMSDAYMSGISATNSNQSILWLKITPIFFLFFFFKQQIFCTSSQSASCSSTQLVSEVVGGEEEAADNSLQDMDASTVDAPR